MPPAPDDGGRAASAIEAEEAWWHYWAAQSPELREYLAELREIEGLARASGDVESAKLAVIKEKRTRNAQAAEEVERARAAVERGLRRTSLWNIHNTPGLADLDDGEDHRA